MNTSESIKNISSALVKFHGIVGKIKKGEKNPFFKSSYASLANILDAIHEPLNECGLVVLQFPDAEGLTTRLQHESGEFMQSTYTMPVAKANDPQAVGSAITYARRYAIGAVLCLNIDEDDDGNRASGHKIIANTTRTTAPTSTPTPAKTSKPSDWVRGQLKTERDTTLKAIYTLLISNDIPEDTIGQTCRELKNGADKATTLNGIEMMLNAKNKLQ